MTDATPFSSELQDFIESASWIFAKTYAKTWPHEYIVRDRVDERLFLDLLRHITSHGYQGSFYQKPITYFDHDGRVYWTMGGPVEETIIINRCLKEQSYEYKRDHGLLPEQQEDSEATVEESTPEDTGTLWFPDEVVNIQITCALRFRGYEYEEQVLRAGNRRLEPTFPELNLPVIESLELYEDDMKNFTVFFALQRYLFKWGGEYLTKYSKEHIAFDSLFLHLYKREVPRQYQHRDYQRQWNALRRTEIEKAAAYVRNSFRRVGEGPTVNI